ncbi:MAG: STAS domain-containing protein [Solirubrobacteraceae bacterium]
MGYPQLAVEHFEDRGVHIIALSGELDLASVGDMQAALSAAQASEQPRVCLDLADLQFIDSTGLATVIRTHLAIEGAGGALAVVCSDNPVRRTVETTGLFEMLTVTDSREAGLLALERPDAAG